MDNYFSKLNAINVNDKVEKKNGLSYLSWAYAWGEVKKLYPDANYKVCKFDGLPYVYDPQSGIIVYTEVTIEGITHEMWLPVMDGANKAQTFEDQTYKVWNKWEKTYEEKTISAATMFDINKTIMRCLTKNLAMFGLGLYIYAGEDIPEEEAKAQKEETAVQEQPSQAVQARRAAKTKSPAPAAYEPMPDEMYWKVIAAYAQGKKTKTGGDYKETWVKTTHAGVEQILKFDNDVDNWRAANIPAESRTITSHIQDYF